MPCPQEPQGQQLGGTSKSPGALCKHPEAQVLHVAGGRRPLHAVTVTVMQRLLPRCCPQQPAAVGV
jgi:hypothetical protein